MLFAAGSMAMLIRAELFEPGLQILRPHIYNEMVSMHGFIMILGVIVPAWTGIANWQLPLMLGASDMAFPRINNSSFWLLPAAFTLMLGSLLFAGASPDFGWTGYAPLSSHGDVAATKRKYHDHQCYYGDQMWGERLGVAH